MDDKPKGLAVLLGLGAKPEDKPMDGGPAPENAAATSPECVAAAADVMEAFHGGSAKNLSSALGDWMDLYQSGPGAGHGEPDGDEAAPPDEASE